jgi:hypothetical protein
MHTTTERLLVFPLRRLLASMPSVDGRFLLLGGVGAYLATIAAARLVWRLDLWPLVGVPSGPSLFFDARNLTAAWECQRLGYDPLYECPRDPWGRPLMYLRPWLIFGVFGFDQSHTTTLAAGLIAAMFVSWSLVVGRVPGGTGLVLLLAACSPAIMLAVERGNMDIALFSVAAVSILLWRVAPRAAPVCAPTLMLLAAMAKIYPVFALPAFALTRSRAGRQATWVCLCAFCGYVLYYRADIAHVATIAPQGEHFSYGARILLAHLFHQTGMDTWNAPWALKQVIAALSVGLAAGISVGILRRFASRQTNPERVTSSLIAFYVGAFIYVGTFVVMNSFDYRLVFLLLTLPQLGEWVRTPASGLSTLAAATIVVLSLLLWVGSLSQRLNLWDELTSWALAGLLIALITATCPIPGWTRPWLKDIL